MAKRKKIYSLVVYVPEADAESLKEALFAAGAGRIGNYEACVWQTLGTGQFRPLSGANPTLGEVGEIEKVQELRVEMVCALEHLDVIERALHEAHPYETPAYYFHTVESA